MPQDWDYCSDSKSGKSVLVIIERPEDINLDRAAMNRRAWCVFDVPCPKGRVQLSADYQEVTGRLADWPETQKLARELLQERL